MKIIFDLQRFATISNYNSNTLLSGTSDNDSIYNQYTTNVTINTGAGSDTIYSWGGQKGTIDGGADNDYIHIGHWVITDDNWFYGSQNLLKGGAGNDSIRNWGASATINGGSGNDSLLNYGEYSTIIGGKGNDTIYNNWDFSTNSSHSENYAWNAVFQYSSGDGKDIIYGFKADSTLSIGGGSYSTTKSGSDIIVTVDNGKITLVGASSLSAVNIKFKKSSSKVSIPSGAYTYNGHSYYLYSKYDFTWTEAKVYCESLGGHLVTITEKNEQSLIDSIIKEKATLDRSNGKYHYWIGGFENSSGTWQWITDEKFDFTNWDSGEPNNHPKDTEQALMVYNDSRTGKWNDSPIDCYGNGQLSSSFYKEHFGFICEWDTVTTSGGNSKLITLTEGNDTYNNSVKGATINALGGNDYIYNNSLGSNSSINCGAGDDSVYNDWNVNNVTIQTGTGNDSVIQYQGKNILMDLGEGNDYVYNTWEGSSITILGGAGNDTIDSDASKLVVSGGDGNDSISLYGGENITVTGGTGKDTIHNNGSKVIFNYSSGDGNDKIYGFRADSTLSIGGGSYSTKKSGSNIIVTVGNGKITLVGATNLSKVNIKGTKAVTETNSWKLSGTTATYGTSSKTLATVNGAKSTNGLSVSGNTISLKKSALKNQVTISGDYEFNFASNYKKATITGSKNSDTITANGNNLSIAGGKGNDIISLASGAKNNVISYSNGDGKDIIYGLTADDTIRISGSAKVTTSGNDVVFTVGKGKITIKDAKNKTFSYSDAGGNKIYPTVSPSPDDGDVYTIKGKGITLSSAYTEESFDVSEVEGGDNIVTINASMTSGLDITGNALANKIIGSAGNDTIDGGNDKKNDTLTGGDGEDIFFYSNGNGNDIITDYEEKDTIKIAKGSVSDISSPDGRDVVLTVGKGSITIKNAAKKKVGITYIENGVEQGYIDGEKTVLKNGKGTVATITANYWKTNFNFSTSTALATVDASPVMQGLQITGNKLPDSINGSVYNDYISGGAGNDTIEGNDGNDTIESGTGNDTLQGGDGKDIFVYSVGDGDDFIVDYRPNDDTIWIKSGTIDDAYASEGNVILRIGSGRITIKDGKNKPITIKDRNGETTTQTYKEKSQSNVWTDYNYELSPNLSTIVRSKSADYSFMNTSTKLSRENNLIVYAKR